MSKREHPGNGRFANFSRAPSARWPEKVREANELITKALQVMIPDPPMRVFSGQRRVGALCGRGHRQ